MNCQTSPGLFSDYYDGGLSEGERRALEQHLRDCQHCTTEYRMFTQSMTALHDSQPVETTALFLAQVRTAASQQMERREKLLRPHSSQAITMVTPKADALPPEAVRPSAPIAAAPAGGVPGWVPWAFAASALLAFFLGAAAFPSRRPDPAAEDARVQKLIAEALAKRPAVRVPVEAPVDVEKVLSDSGLVKLQGEWVPRRMKEGFDRGLVCVNGRMMSREELALQLAREFPAKPVPPPPPPTAPSVDEILDQAGFVRVNDVPVPKAWVEKWGEGLVQTGPNEWRRAADFREDLVREHNLVQFRGKLMTREQADALQAQMLVRAPENATATNDFTRQLDGLQIGPPMNFRGLTVYPLLADNPPEPAFTTLHAALATGKLEITDVLGLFGVQVKNPLENDLVLLQGEMLAGGRCMRVVAETTVVPRGQTLRVPVLCVEPSAWRSADRFAKESGHYIASPTTRRSLVWEQGQGALWAALSARLGDRNSAAGIFRKHADAIGEVRSYFAALADREPQAVGLAVAVGDALEFAELFRDRELFLSSFDRIIAGAAIEILERGAGPAPKTPSAYPNSVRGVKDLLESAFHLSYDTREEGYGVRKDEAWVGRVYAPAGEVVHAFLFASGAPEWDRKAAYTVPRDKLKRAVDDVEARMKNLGPSGKIAALRDLATINAPDVTVALLKHLSETDAGVRRAVIQQLAATGDARVTEPLLQLLVRSRADLAQYAEILRALARLGDERAVEPLLKQLDLGEADTGRALLASLPELLLQVRTRDLLERATGR
ncbi:MAG TPA: DUF6569 family protein, partial [Planctomycetota bacterium]|nr:DUF6569 family protein [Planctomycetota bacterium]